MPNSEVFYFLSLQVEPKNSGRLTTAAVAHCPLCDGVAKGMGGPGGGQILCETCGNKIKTGQYKLELK